MTASVLSFLAALVAPGESSACSVGELRGSPGYQYRVERIEQFVDSASVIVRARALTGAPRDSVTVKGYLIPFVRFLVVERIRAPDSLTHVELPGEIVARDDFNAGNVPYTMVRLAGHRGDCEAKEYRAGAEYLLLLRPGPLGLTAHWKPLAPLNEQVRGDADPWLTWVRNAARRPTGSSTLRLQTKPAPRPAVFLREIRIDPLLLAFGLDSARVRRVLTDVLRDAGRLAAEGTVDVPSMDIAVTVPRTLAGRVSDPLALLGVEVGRNLMERGAGNRLVWELTSTLPGARTWRDLTAGTLPEIIWAVYQYLKPPEGGA